MVKYAFGFPVVALVSHIPVKSRMALNYVTTINSDNPTHKLLLTPLMFFYPLRQFISPISAHHSHMSLSNSLLSARTYSHTLQLTEKNVGWLP